VSVEGDRAAVVGLGVEFLDQPGGGQLVEQLPERHGEVVHRLAGVRGVAQAAAQLHRGEVDQVLESDQAAFEGQHRGPGRLGQCGQSHRHRPLRDEGRRHGRRLRSDPARAEQADRHRS